MVIWDERSRRRREGNDPQLKQVQNLKRDQKSAKLFEFLGVRHNGQGSLFSRPPPPPLLRQTYLVLYFPRRLSGPAVASTSPGFCRVQRAEVCLFSEQPNNYAQGLTPPLRASQPPYRFVIQRLHSTSSSLEAIEALAISLP